MRVGDWRGASAAFETALQHEPANRVTLLRLGISRQHLAEWEGAAASFKAAVVADEGKSHGYYQLDWRHRLAFAYRMSGRPFRARSVYAEAAELDPSLSEWLSSVDLSLADAGTALLWQLVDAHPAVAGEAAALKMIEAAEPTWKQLPDKWWFSAYSQLYRRGWPRAAYAAKAAAADVARQCSSEPARQSTARRLLSARAFSDAGDYTRARYHLAAASARAPADELREVVDTAAGLALLDGDFAAAGNAWRQIPETPEDAAFGKLVRNRSVAIVAAADTGLDQGREIDGFDLVVRTNFRGREVLDRHARQIGRRTDICYFNGNFEPEHRDRIIETLKRDPIEFVVLRFDDDSRKCYQPIVPARVTHLLNAFYRMNSYAVPKIVFDLLRFQPSRIKVFNADFFIGGKSHYAGYLDYDIDLIRSLRGHDVMRNIRLMREWLRLGLVEGDDVFLEVLSRSEDELLDRIEEKLREAIEHQKVKKKQESAR